MYGIYKIMKKITLIIMEGAQFDQSNLAASSSGLLALIYMLSKHLGLFPLSYTC